MIPAAQRKQLSTTFGARVVDQNARRADPAKLSLGEFAEFAALALGTDTMTSTSFDDDRAAAKAGITVPPHCDLRCASMRDIRADWRALWRRCCNQIGTARPWAHHTSHPDNHTIGRGRRRPQAARGVRPTGRRGNGIHCGVQHGPQRVVAIRRHHRAAAGGQGGRFALHTWYSPRMLGTLHACCWPRWTRCSMLWP